MQAKIDKALDLIITYSQIDGDHHKLWVFDQVVRALLETEEEYNKFIIKYQEGEDGPETYIWDEGIAP